VPPLLAGDVDSWDYASAFGVSAVACERSAELLARAMFEDAPRLLRWPVLLGWRTVLQLRLGPLGSRDHVLGWRIVHNEHGRLDLEVGSPFLHARKVVLVTSASAVVATIVNYRTRYARPIWSAVSVVHHRTEPMLLTRAARLPPR